MRTPTVSLLLLLATFASFAAATESYGWYRATDVMPTFPTGLRCSKINAAFGSSVHLGGMHLEAIMDTPVVAVANGQVIATGKGGKEEGYFLWLRLAPVDTELPFWTFVKYQHLSSPPLVDVGAQIKGGQVIAKIHDNSLELVTTYGPSPAFKLGGLYQSVVKGEGAMFGDPMIIYLGNGIAHPAAVHELPATRRQVAVSTTSTDKLIHLANSKAIWPLACRT
jgi:hypothetical protein